MMNEYKDEFSMMDEYKDEHKDDHKDDHTNECEQRYQDVEVAFQDLFRAREEKSYIEFASLRIEAERLARYRPVNVRKIANMKPKQYVCIFDGIVDGPFNTKEESFTYVKSAKKQFLPSCPVTLLVQDVLNDSSLVDLN